VGADSHHEIKDVSLKIVRFHSADVAHHVAHVSGDQELGPVEGENLKEELLDIGYSLFYR